MKNNNLVILNQALWLKKERILIVGDLHLGYEEYLLQKGILVPKFQIKQILEQFKELFKQVKPLQIIINGDLKHDFGRILKPEWNNTLKVLDFLLQNCRNLILIKGNHDTILGPITEKKQIQVFDHYLISDVLITHGHKIIETEAKTIIIGHEHPAVTLRDHGKVETFKCFLYGNWSSQELVVIPSFNPLLEGTDLSKEKLLSPYLQDIRNFHLLIFSKNEVFNFGQIKELKH